MGQNCNQYQAKNIKYNIIFTSEKDNITIILEPKDTIKKLIYLYLKEIKFFDYDSLSSKMFFCFEGNLIDTNSQDIISSYMKNFSEVNVFYI